MLHGVFTALVTPFRDGCIDSKALLALVERQVQAGVEGMVPVGTTGESATLSHHEHIQVIEMVVQQAAGRTRVIAGTGSNSTREAIELTQAAEKAGADGVLVVSPYYNRPTQAGLIAHFEAVCQSTPLPVVLYNIPSRCGVDLLPETVAEIAQRCPNAVAIKEASGSVDRVSRLKQCLPEEFAILSGDDSLTLPFLSLGATGVISVASNLVPREVGSLVRSFCAGNPSEALQWHRKLYPLFRDLFLETNPVPVKQALAFLGWMSAEVRLPLVPMEPANWRRLEQTLRSLGLVPS